MLFFISIIPGTAGLYLVLSLIFARLAQQMPRNAVSDPPGRGEVHDTMAPALNGGYLETW